MPPGPAKRFEPEIALERARDLFWRRGYDGTGIRDLEAALGVGRKSLYDTFGSKRALYLAALRQYTDSVIARICQGLADPRSGAMQNLDRVLGKLQKYHGSSDSLGCLLGVAMGQADPDDMELAALLRGYLQRLEDAFQDNLAAAQRDGDLQTDVRPRDVARSLVALVQGMALIGRISPGATQPRSMVRAALQSLRA